MGIIGDAWDWTKGAYGTLYDETIGRDKSYTPPGAPKQVSKVTKVEAAAFDPYSNQQAQQGANPFADDRYRGVYNDAGAAAEAATSARAGVERELTQGYSAPVINQPRVGNVNVNTAGVGAGIDRAVGQLGQADIARGNQQDVYGTAMSWAGGNMPSVGRGMANEAGVTANAQFQRAGSEATQAYGSNAVNAARAYQDALAAQTFATQQAGTNSARQTRDAAQDAILRQAAFASGARGGNIGLAMRQGQQGAAMQSADANRQASRIMSDANTQASYNAAAGQRATQAAALQGNLATMGTQERAGMAAAAAQQEAMFRGAQISSQEQQNALNLAAGQANAIRGADLSGVGAATSIGGLGLGMDQLVTGTNASNLDRSLGAQLSYDQLGSANQLATNNLNASVLAQQAGRYQGDQQFGMGTQTGMVQQATQQDYQMAMAAIQGDQQLAAMYAQMDESAKQRMLDEYAIRQGEGTARRGQNTQMAGGAAGALGTLGAAAIMMSDKRAKKNIKKTAAPDFRRAGSYSYQYKDTSLPGTRPGRQRGPMAHELPADVVVTGKDGLKRVDIGKLALAAVSAIGDLQRKVG